MINAEKSRYVAYVLHPQGAVQWVDLGEAGAINSAVDAWRSALRDPNRIDVKRLARALDEHLMRPVRKLLGATQQLIVSPDA
jgi:hypothetical protein